MRTAAATFIVFISIFMYTTDTLKRWGGHIFSICELLLCFQNCEAHLFMILSQYTVVYSLLRIYRKKFVRGPHFGHSTRARTSLNAALVVCVCMFQLDPPNSMQLYLRGASVCFLFEQSWNLSAVRQGRWLRILL